jgi:L-rhamnose mutarotase
LLSFFIVDYFIRLFIIVNSQFATDRNPTELPSEIETPEETIAMKRVGFVLKVKQEKLAEYKDHHQRVWPEMLEALRRTGWHNYSLFLREDGLLFGYFETPDSFEAALDGMAHEEVNARWQAFMAPYFEGLGAHADQMMQALEEVFHLD